MGHSRGKRGCDCLQEGCIQADTARMLQFPRPGDSKGDSSGFWLSALACGALSSWDRCPVAGEKSAAPKGRERGAVVGDIRS